MDDIRLVLIESPYVSRNIFYFVRLWWMLINAEKQPEDYWEVLAEQRRVALDETLRENLQVICPFFPSSFS